MADPAAMRRGGTWVDAEAVAVQCPAHPDGTPGPVLHVEPARMTALDILNGRGTAYARAAWTLRDQWVRAGLAGGDGKPDWGLLAQVVFLAVRWAYPDATDADVEAWVGWDRDPAPALDIARVACGLTPTPAARFRSRAIALALAGLGDAPLSAQEAAPLDDWTRNAGLAPAPMG